MNNYLSITLAAALSLAALSVGVTGEQAQPPAKAGAKAPVKAKARAAKAPATPVGNGLAAFDKEIEAYLALQRQLLVEAKPLAVTTNPREIASSSDILAGAIQRARPNARQGAFFNPAAARAIAERLRASLAGSDVPALVASLNDEPIVKGPPQVYMRFPVAESMASMPGKLLEILPVLPKELEYRFVGRHLILRDRHAAMILDYISQALPAR